MNIQGVRTLFDKRILTPFPFPQRVATIKALNIFDEEMYLREVYQPILDVLGVKRPELRRLSRVAR